jgi:hypothetical protein
MAKKNPRGWTVNGVFTDGGGQTVTMLFYKEKADAIRKAKALTTSGVAYHASRVQGLGRPQKAGGYDFTKSPQARPNRKTKRDAQVYHGKGRTSRLWTRAADMPKRSKRSGRFVKG